MSPRLLSALSSFVLLAAAASPVEAGETFSNGIGMKMIRLVDKDYYLAATELTQVQWKAVMDSNPSHFKGDDRQAESVTWDEAVDFCERLTRREKSADKLPEGYVYELPTEAQWEHACRAGTTGDFGGPIDEMAWIRDNSGDTTRPVGTKRANAWGFHDMHGNLNEWCLSAHEGSGRAAIRGGSWRFAAEDCASGNRIGWWAPTAR